MMSDEQREEAREDEAEDLALDDKAANQIAGGSRDIFLKPGDIKGESIDDKHKGVIE
jgi:hypothetical protein